MIYYWPGADHPIPSGGVATHYEHVAHLVDAGLDAAILHLQPGFRPTWFAHDVPIVYAPDVTMTADDVLVMNEILGPPTVRMVPGVRKLIFCQNVHYAWRGWPVPPASPLPYRDAPEIVGTMVLTEYEANHFRWAFPDHPVSVVPHGFDPARWPHGTAKARQIAYMPRKHADEAQQVFGWLHARGALDGWRVVPINDQSQAKTSRLLQDSLVFFAFGYPEGGTKPPFEAALSGCYVLGYDGFASGPDMARCGMTRVPNGDSCLFAEMAEAVLARPSAVIAERGAAMGAAVRAHFSPARERAALLAVMTPLLGRVAA